MEERKPPTPYRISTITTTATIGCEINLDTLYDNLEICDGNSESGITYLEYGKKKSETVYKGFSKKFLINRRRERPTKRFDNQLTIVHKISPDTSVNMKVFKNGNIQMTGVKDPQQGSDIVDLLINMIRKLYDDGKTEIVTDIKNVKNDKYKIQLINSDYRMGFEIKREKLFEIIIDDYENLCSFEPCIYQGVKLQYFWNSIIPTEQRDGVCRCTTNCFLKKKSGTGHGDSNCKKITIALFASGATIITGSQNINQINDCYSFINKVVYDNSERIACKSMA